jgi:hypothetical protein
VGSTGGIRPLGEVGREMMRHTLPFLLPEYNCLGWVSAADLEKICCSTDCGCAKNKAFLAVLL